MTSFYSIFGHINYFNDSQGTVRGMRKRPVDTKIFIISGEILARIDAIDLPIKSGTEFTFSKNRWHGWLVTRDCKLIQEIPHFDPNLELKKEYD